MALFCLAPRWFWWGLYHRLWNLCSSA